MKTTVNGCDNLRAFRKALQTKPAKINDPSGGATVDAEARTAINTVIDALEALKLTETT